MFDCVVCSCARRFARVFDSGFVCLFCLVALLLMLCVCLFLVVAFMPLLVVCSFFVYTFACVVCELLD